MTNLTILANKHNTDKGTVAYEAHGYTEEYSKYIPEIGNYGLLEIGYYHGDSARAWKEYNNSLSLAFIDIDRNCINHNKEHSNLYIGDVKNPKLINEIIQDYEIEGGFDFVIDDGSHNYIDIFEAFKLLFTKLNKKGLYFIEDLHAPHAQKEKLIQDINIWLSNNHIEYEDLGLFCNNKLWILRYGIDNKF